MKHAANMMHKMHTSFSVADHSCQNAGTKITGRINCISCFHTETEPYAKNGEEDCHGDEIWWSWPIPFIRYEQDHNDQYSGSQELETCELM